MENDGQGSIYIFRGEGRGRINPTYSQRIAASEIQSGLKLFGISISQSSYDQSGDGLPDLAVGSKGNVILLRLVQKTLSIQSRMSSDSRLKAVFIVSYGLNTNSELDRRIFVTANATRYNKSAESTALQS
ncbi:hypothetical protein XENOCAPTIV_017076 [Xenoophorus captivus]|uniref:Uncharacterized protein n=1 Tax=Xenoophorus captivus TaxID=1517983 RepID=A0ABV0R0S5_9TELE